MSAKVNRRGAVQSAAAAGGLLLFGGATAAQQPEAERNRDSLAGEWFNNGKLDQPCAIFQAGRVLILVNEKGDIASGRMTEANEFRIVQGWGGGDLSGRVGERGKVILWKGTGNWKRT